MFNPADGSQTTIEIETTTPGVFVAVNGVDSYDRNDQSTTKKQSVFMQAQQAKNEGPADVTVTMGGLVDPADAGFLRLAALRASKGLANLQITHDGVNGYTQLFKIASLNSKRNPDDFVQFTATLEGNADAVLVGTGPIF